MTWVRLDDGFANHPKFRGLSDAAFRLHLSALGDCALHLTDGRIGSRNPESLPRAPQGRKLKATIDELVSSGLWEPHPDGGWQIHDYLEYQPSRAKVLADREASADRVSNFRARKAAERNATRNAVTHPSVTPDVTPLHDRYKAVGNGVGNGEVTPPPIPIPIPIPDQIQPEDDDPRPDRLGPAVGAPAPGPASSSSSSGSRGEPELDGIPDGDRQTLCPLDLAERFAGYRELSQALGCSEAELRDTAARFVGYWTIGAGAGKRRAHWARRLREELRQHHAQGGEFAGRTRSRGKRTGPIQPNNGETFAEYLWKPTPETTDATTAPLRLVAGVQER